jgi:hypothetical protein
MVWGGHGPATTDHRLGVHMLELFLLLTITILTAWWLIIPRKAKSKNLITNKDAVTSTTGFIEYTGSTPPIVGMYPPSVVNGVKVH